MDGGSITAPNLAIWTPEEGWVVENEGVPPDIEVEQTPKDVTAGRDPQLERASRWRQTLKEAPPKPSRPAYPERGKTLERRRTTSGGAGRTTGSHAHRRTTTTLETLFSELMHGVSRAGGFMLNVGDHGLLRSLERVSAARRRR